MIMKILFTMLFENPDLPMMNAVNVLKNINGKIYVLHCIILGRWLI